MPPPMHNLADPAPSPPRWHFAVAGSPQRQRNSMLDEHFAGSGSNRTGDVIREGGQNSGDAPAIAAAGPVRVRVGFGELDAKRAAVYAAGLAEHAAAAAKQASAGAATALPVDAPCRFLTFEDFNTTGLTGQTEVERRYKTDPPNAFHTFFRAEGQTDKVDGTKQGSKGVGKVTFLAVSRSRAVFGLTCRPDDGRTLLFGTAVLQTHRQGNDDYDGDGWFGRVAPGGKRIDPIEDAPTLDRFRDDFSLARKPDEPGFSIVVPWLDDDPDDGVTPERVIDAVLRDHALPILHGRLTFEVVAADGTETVIDAARFLTVLDARPDPKLVAQVRPMAELATWAHGHPPTAVADRLGLHKETAPAWSDPDLVTPEQRDRLRAALEAGDPIAVRVPVRIRRQSKGAAETISEFDIYLRKDPAGTASVAAAAAGRSGTVQFVRGGLLISGMGRQLSGYRGLVVANDPALAGFLRAAENPSHTKWSAKPQEVKNIYKYAPGTLSYVVDAARELSKLLAGDPAERDARVWADVLSLPAGDLTLAGTGGKGTRTRPKPKGTGGGSGGTTTTKILITPPVKKRPYDVIANPTTGGFTVKPNGLPFPGPLPARVELRFAYYLRGRDSFAKWTTDDFDLTHAASFPSTARNCAVEVREPNRLVLSLSDPNFQFAMSGFDTRREPDCKHRLLKPLAAASPDAAVDGDDDYDDGSDDDATPSALAASEEVSEGGAA